MCVNGSSLAMAQIFFLPIKVSEGILRNMTPLGQNFTPVTTEAAGSTQKGIHFPGV